VADRNQEILLGSLDFFYHRNNLGFVHLSFVLCNQLLANISRNFIDNFDHLVYESFKNLPYKFFLRNRLDFSVL